MCKRLPLLLLASLLSLPIYAQLVKDAKALAETFRKAPAVELDLGNEPIRGLQIYHNALRLSPEEIRPRMILELGQYELYGLDRSIALSYGDRSVPINPADKVTIQNDPLTLSYSGGSQGRLLMQPNHNSRVTIVDPSSDSTHTYTHFASITDFIVNSPIDAGDLSEPLELSGADPESFDIEIYQINGADTLWLLYRRDPFLLQPSGKPTTFFYRADTLEWTSDATGSIPKKELQDQLCILLRHSEFADETRFYGQPLSKLADVFAENPYLHDYLPEDLFPENTLYIQEYWFPADFGCELTADPSLSWQDILYREGKVSLESRTRLQEVIEDPDKRILARDRLERVSQISTARSEQLQPQGIDATAIIVGLSDFITERAQEELYITFLEHFQEMLNDTSKEIHILFPNTVNLLNQFDVVNYRQMLQTAKPAFLKDLQHLALHFPQLLKLEKYQQFYDSPEVFNLALFYEITNMVYLDIPVDTVLLKTYQDLRIRQEDLTATILNRVAHRLYQNGAASARLNSLSNDMSDYCSKLRGQYEELRYLSATLTAELDTLELLQSNILPSPPQHISSLINSLQSNLANLVADQERLLAKSENSTSDEVFDYFENYLQANLSGEDYYGYALQNPDLERFDHYFGHPTEPVELVTKGLRQSRVLLDMQLPGDYQYWQSEAGELEESVRQLKTEILKMIAGNLDVRLERVRAKKELLRFALEAEAAFWRKRPRTHQQVSALQFLDSVLTKNDIWAEVDHTLLYDPTPVRALLQSEEYFARINQRVALAESNLEEVYWRTQQQLAILQERQAGLKINSAWHQAHQEQMALRMEHWTQVDSLVDAFCRWREQSVVPGTRRPGPDDLMLEDIDTFKVNLSNLNATYEQLLAELRQDLADDMAANPGKYVQADQEMAPLYSATHNLFLAELESRLASERLIDSSKYVQLDQIAQGLSQCGTWIEETKEKTGKLKSGLEDLEREHGKSLFAARQNAEDLTRAMELGIHLLFSFQQDYHLDSLVLYDTLQVTITERRPERLAVETDTMRSYLRTELIPLDTIPDPAFRKWISKVSFDSIMADPFQRAAFLGLLYQRLQSVQVAPGRLSPKGLSVLATEGVNAFADIDDYRQRLKQKKARKEKLSFQDYYPFIRTSVQMINTTLTTQIGQEALVDKYPSLRPIPGLTENGLSMYESIFAKQYGQALYHAMDLLKIIWDAEFPSERKANGKLKLSDDQKKNERVRNAILLYGTFMAQVLDADSPEEVKAALDAAAVPVGSSRNKREQIFNLSINSYLGVAVSNEKLERPAPGQAPDRLAFGLSVPVGVSASFALSWPRHSSISVFASLLDLGAVTSFRINDPYAEDLPELNFKNVFAPGGFLIYNFPKSPISLGFGFQQGPQLRSITENGIEIDKSSAFRGPIGFLSIDVPLFNLYQGPKRLTKIHK